MKKIRLSIILVIVSIVASFGIGCADKDVATMSFSKPTYSIEQGSSITLKVDTTLVGDISWSSSEPDIASVDKNGVVIGFKLGNAIITAQIGDVNAHCEVIVDYKAKDTPPTISKIDPITIKKGENITPKIEVKHLNKVVNAKYHLTSNNTSVASVSDNQIRGENYGRAMITASATYNGLTTTSDIIVIVSEKVFLSLSDYDVELDVNTSSTINYVLKIDGNVDTTSPLLWESSDTTVAKVSNGVISGVSGGNATVTASYVAKDGYTSALDISVKINKIVNNDYAQDIFGTYDLSKPSFTLSMPLDIVVTNTKMEGGQIVNFEQTSVEGKTKLKLSTEKLSLKYGEQVVLVETKTTRYNIKVILASKIIDSVSEWKEMFTIAEDLGGANSKQWIGYFALGGNIDFKNEYITGITGDTNAQTGWMATLDGRGYTISNFTIDNVWRNGLIGGIGKNGIVKNFAVVNANMISSASGIIASSCYGTIENIYVNGKLHFNGNKDGCGGIAFKIFEGAKVQNCILEVDVLEEGNSILTLSGISYVIVDDTHTPAYSTIANCYVISTTLPKALKISNGVYSDNTTDEEYVIDTVATFTSSEKFKAANIDLTSFNENIWTLNGSDLPKFIQNS